MGCADSKTSKTTGEVVDYKNVPATDSAYPPPYIPETTKSDIYASDIVKDMQDRINKMPNGTAGQYSTLIKYLSEGTTKEVHLVTAIYLWMKCQDYTDPNLDLEKTENTPRGYMKMIKDGTGDVTKFFTILCRHSRIPCIILNGLGKSDQYIIGSSESKMITKWTAVFADQEWKLVHVEWALLEAKDGNQNTTEPIDSDFFFLTDPKDFAVLCLPEDFRWQLLNHCFTKTEFLSLPNMRPSFLRMDGSVLSPKTGTTKAINGKLDVEITFPKQQMDKTNLSYKLQYLDVKNNNKNEETKVIPNKLEKYVFLNRKSTKFIFEICFPIAGKYLLDIFGENEREMRKDDEGTTKSPSDVKRLCQFKIISDKDFETDDLDLLPDTPKLGWGPGPHCRHLGLVPLTNLEGSIFIKPGEFRDIGFRMLWNLDVQCQLIHNFLPVYQLVEQVEVSKQRDEVYIRVQIPEEGQYALKIYCREAGTQELFETCVYLLKQREKARLPEKIRDKMLRTRIEYHIANHTTQQELEDALDVFQCYNVPDQGERQKAKEKLTQYWEVKRELQAAIKGRNIYVIRKWLDRAKKSKYSADLQEHITKAENMQGNIKKLKGYLHPIARMDPQNIIEIRNYKRPPNIVHDVMKSTYLLLGEEKYDLEEWYGIQYLMGKQGKESIQKRVIDRRPEDVHVEIAEEADSIIKPYSMHKCREVSNGICTFYKWNQQFIRDVRGQDKDRQESYREFSNQETFRDTESDGNSTIPPVSSSEPIVFTGRRSATEDGKRAHPFAIEEDTDEDKKIPCPYIKSAQPSKPDRIEAVSYAGFKSSIKEE